MSEDPFDEVCVLERRLLDPEVRADRAALEDLFHPDFVEYGSSGRIWTRDAIIDNLTTVEDVTIADIVVRDMQARQVGPGVVLLTFVSVLGERSVLRSSVWVDTPDGWRIRFHQGTTRS